MTILEASKVASESKRIDRPGNSRVYPGGGVGLGANAPINPNFANPQVNDSRSIRQISADALHVKSKMVPNNCQGQERVLVV